MYVFLLSVGIPADYICATGPGRLGCKEIIHAGFGRNPQLIRKNCKKVLKDCERKGHVSVAFPAVSTGEFMLSASLIKNLLKQIYDQRKAK